MYAMEKKINHLINIKDIPVKDIKKILKDARYRKKLRKNFNTLQLDKNSPLKGKLLIQMFEKSSLRTRISFYLAIRQLGGSALTLRPEELHFGKNEENLSDVAKIISSYADIFMFRTNNEKKLIKFANHLSIPMINGLSPLSHPAQIISDIFTIEEIKKKPIKKLNICWIGDSNNVLNSLVEVSVKLGLNLNVVSPKKYLPKRNLINYIKNNKAKIEITDNINQGLKNADVLMTDKVISMNDKVNKKKKEKYFKKFKINKLMLKAAKKDCIVLHCLPRGKEISDEVFYSNQSKVWEQAKNRVHVQKSILLYCLNKLG